MRLTRWMTGRWRRVAIAFEDTEPMAQPPPAPWTHLGRRAEGGHPCYFAPADVSPLPDPPMQDLPAGRRRDPQLHAPLGDPPWGRPDTEATQLISAQAGPLCRAHQLPGCTACAWPARW